MDLEGLLRHLSNLLAIRATRAAARFCIHKGDFGGLRSVIHFRQTEVRMSRFDLSDVEWRLIKPLLPNKPRGVARVWMTDVS
jgi:hypothetical protein